MIVQHNLTAMNANRQLGMVGKNLAKATEKLSSGYKINRAADDVRAEDAVHQRLAALRGRHVRELPEASVQQRKRGHGMVARGHRQHPPLGPTLEILLRHHQNARMLRQVHLDATLEDVGVVPDVPRLELAFATHRDRLHGPRTLDARLPDSCKECADGVHARES